MTILTNIIIINICIAILIIFILLKKIDFNKYKKIEYTNINKQWDYILEKENRKIRIPNMCIGWENDKNKYFSSVMGWGKYVICPSKVVFTFTLPT